MLESLRGMGYTTATAIADIIDNSISAGADTVRVDFHWADDASVVRIIDNGNGMPEDILEEAMRLGSSNPLETRAATDLGRFGMGMKTASLSQCKRLTVGSKIQGGIAYRRWDLDHISREGGIDWSMLDAPAEESNQWFSPLEGLLSGTIVLWERCDRIVTEGFSDRDFLDLIDRVERQLAMVFHRYLENPSPKLRLYVNGDQERHRVRPWDPFMTSHAATLRTPVERIPTPAGTIEVQGHVLPHRDRLSDKEFESGSGPEGWAAQQGFYVYRNHRLLVAGGWLGMGTGREWTKEEAHKLARIRVDIPNTADADWKIDIRKSMARPPVTAKKRLTQLAEKVRSDARRVFAHRGQYGPGTRIADLLQAWRVHEGARGVRYLIDESHPAVRSVLDQAGDLKSQIKTMLRVIEESVPVQRIWLDTVERGDVPLAQTPLSIPDELMETLKEMYADMTGRTGMLPDVAVQQLLRTAPFNRYPAAVLALPSGEPNE